MTTRAGWTTDIERLYPQLAPQLRRILQRNLRAPDWLLEDACQVAWEALLASPAPVDRPRVLSWLATTARREALAMLKRAEADQLLEEAERPLEGAAAAAADPQRTAEFWERLGQIRRLPRRQQRVVWMQGMGFRYDEIAAQTGLTRRTVERQLLAARHRLDTVGDERGRPEQSGRSGTGRLYDQEAS